MNNALLSRGNVERLNLNQTKQYTDKIDKQYGIWYDIWLDTVDIHKRINDRNKYGSVLLEFKIQILTMPQAGEWWITKLNPTHWSGKEVHEKWFQSEEEVEEGFKIGDFNHSLVFRHSGGQLNYQKKLKRIILDDPHMYYTEVYIDFFSLAYGALMVSMKDSDYICNIEKRKCYENCICQKSWQKDNNGSIKSFIPIV